MIEERLAAFLENETREAIEYSDSIGRLYNDLREYIFRGGKRLASCSTLFAYKGFTGEADSRILDVCAGIELYRHSILIHDDLVDEDELRRGPALSTRNILNCTTTGSGPVWLSSQATSSTP